MKQQRFVIQTSKEIGLGRVVIHLIHLTLPSRQPYLDQWPLARPPFRCTSIVTLSQLANPSVAHLHIYNSLTILDRIRRIICRLIDIFA